MGRHDETRIALIAALAVIATPTAALGSVGFSAGQTLSYFGPSGSALADFDGDGRLDLAVGSTGCCQDPGVFPGNGDGTFGAIVAVPGSGDSGLRVVDVNGDTRPDLVGVEAWTASVTVLTNTSTPGAISFSEVTLSNAAGSYGEADVGDVDGDGRPDLVVGGQSKVQMALGSPGGGFGAFADVSSSPGLSLHLADVTGGPALDLVQITGLASAGELRVAAGDGAGGFAAPQTLAMPSGGGFSELADLDGDGDTDILVPLLDAGSTTMQILRNDAGTFAAAASVTGLSDRPWTVAMTDVDGDGIDDAIVASLNDAPRWVKGTGDAAMFGAVTPLPEAGMRESVLAGDLDGDLRPDAVVLGNTGSSGRVVLNASTVSASASAGASFGTAAIGASADRTLTLTNDGSSVLRPGPTTLAGAHAADFAVLTDGCAQVTLHVGGSCTAAIRFAPSAVGPRTASAAWASARPVPAAAPTVALAGTGAPAPAAPVRRRAPRALSRPLITGASPVRVGSRLAVTTRFSGSPVPRVALRWFRCDALGTRCARIATSPRYRVGAADRGHRLLVRSMAVNSLGGATASSRLTAPVRSALASRQRR